MFEYQLCLLVDHFYVNDVYIACSAAFPKTIKSINVALKIVWNELSPIMSSLADGFCMLIHSTE